MVCRRSAAAPTDTSLSCTPYTRSAFRSDTFQVRTLAENTLLSPRSPCSVWFGRRGTTGRQLAHPAFCNYPLGKARTFLPRPTAAQSHIRPCIPLGTQLPPFWWFSPNRTANRRNCPRSVDRNRGRNFDRGQPGRRNISPRGIVLCSRRRCERLGPL